MSLSTRKNKINLNPSELKKFKESTSKHWAPSLVSKLDRRRQVNDLIKLRLLKLYRAPAFYLLITLFPMLFLIAGFISAPSLFNESSSPPLLLDFNNLYRSVASQQLPYVSTNVSANVIHSLTKSFELLYGLVLTPVSSASQLQQNILQNYQDVIGALGKSQKIIIYPCDNISM